MLKKRFVTGVLGVSAVAALFAMVAVQAQSSGNQTGTPTGGQATGNTQSASPSAAQGSTQPGSSATAAGQAGGATASGTGASGTALSSGDRQIVMNMAQQHMAEIETSRMAQTKSQNAQVKNFAQQMIDDHTRALGEVRQLAQSRKLTVPSELDRTHKARVNRLARLEGEAFDRAYLAQAGVSDHKKSHDMLRKAEARAKDPELKALAARTLPIVDQHLNSAQQLHKNTATGSGRTQGTTGSGKPEDRPRQ